MSFSWRLKLGAWSLELGACGLTPNYTMNSGRAKSKTLSNGASLKALHLVKVQDPFDCIFI